MSTVETKFVQLSKEDREEASRLYREAHTALQGLSKIVARTLGLPLDGDHRVMFAPAGHAFRSPGVEEKKVTQLKGVEIICTPRGCGCINHDTMECYMC
jgi:hypothetical protein